MNKKVSLGVTISLIAVACAITFVLTMTVSLNMYNSMVAGIQERETINAKIKEVDTFVRSSSIYKLDENELITGIANGYISGTEDKYAKYYTADEYYKLQQIQSGVIIGTGVETVVNGDYLEVTNVYDGSSADVEEITKGCMITAIDGKNILEMGAEAAQAKLDGEEGTKLKVTFSTPDGTEKTVTLVRQSIKLTSVKSKLIDGYAYIKIYTFNDTTDDSFIQLIDEYEAQSVLGYIFDVRDVTDGITEPLKAMLNRVLPKATVATQIDANGKDTTFYRNRRAVIARQTDNSAYKRKHSLPCGSICRRYARLCKSFCYRFGYSRKVTASDDPELQGRQCGFNIDRNDNPYRIRRFLRYGNKARLYG